MKVLVIMGSPRKGNTYRAAKRIEDAMRSHGDVGFEYLMLGDVALAPCRGCMACLEWGEEHCPVRDDAPAVREKLQDADGVIFASPVYGLAVTGQMKTREYGYDQEDPADRDEARQAVCHSTVGFPVLQRMLPHPLWWHSPE